MMMLGYRWKWLVGCYRSFIWISSILLPPTIDLHTSAIVCCDQLPPMKVTRLRHLYSVAFPVRASAQRVMGCLCQQIYLLKFRPLSCDTCSNSNKDVTTVRKRGVSYWMTPSYIGAKEWGVRTKVGNRLVDIKWCGEPTGLEPILLIPLKLSCFRICTGKEMHMKN